MQHLMARHNLLLPHTGDWRLTFPYPIGQIHGLPGTHGRLICTNGIACYVLLDEYLTQPDETKQPLFHGHLDFFVSDSRADAEYVDSYRSSGAPRPVGPAKLTVEQLMERYAI